MSGAATPAPLRSGARAWNGNFQRGGSGGLQLRLSSARVGCRAAEMTSSHLTRPPFPGKPTASSRGCRSVITSFFASESFFLVSRLFWAFFFAAR